MVDDRPEDTGPSAESVRPKRAGPTIDLEATEVSGDTRSARRRRGTRPDTAAAAGIGAVPGDYRSVRRRRHRRAGARRGLVPGMERGFADRCSTGRHSRDRWSGRAYRQRRVQNQCAPRLCQPPCPMRQRPRVSTRWRNRRLRCALSSPPRAQSEKLAALVDEMKSAPRESPPPPDLSAINERLAQIERNLRTQGPRSPRRSRRRRMPSRRTTCRFAASWRRPCSTFRFGRANPMSRRWRRRRLSPRMRMR